MNVVFVRFSLSPVGSSGIFSSMKLEAEETALFSPSHASLPPREATGEDDESGSRATHPTTTPTQAAVTEGAYGEI